MITQMEHNLKINAIEKISQGNLHAMEKSKKDK